jgi:hypothetical protein
MKTDLYTKIILTIIALVLTINLFKGSVSSAKAETKKYVSLPVNTDGTINVKIVDCDRDAFFYAQPIPVKVTNN